MESIPKRIVKNDFLWLGLLTTLLILFYSEALIEGVAAPHRSSDAYFTYHYFAELTRELRLGRFPLWDAYTDTPYHLIATIFNPFDVSTVLLSIVGSWFTDSIPLIFQWKAIILSIIGSLGIFFLLKELLKSSPAAVFGFSVALFSAITYTVIRQTSTGQIYFATFWILFFLVRLLRDPSWFNTLGLALFSSWAIQGYTTVYAGIYILCFVALLLIYNQREFLALFKPGRNWLYLTVFGAIVLVSISMVATLFNDISHYSFGVGRQNAFNSYERITEGTHAGIWDYLGLFIPNFTSFFYLFPTASFQSIGFNFFSENFLYIGILSLCLSIYGLLFGKNAYKKHFVILLLITAFLSIGHKSPLHRYFYFALPPFQMARHMHLFNILFLGTLTFFAALGFQQVLQELNSKSFKRLFSILAGMFALGLVTLMSTSYFALDVRADRMPRAMELVLSSHLIGYGCTVLFIALMWLLVRKAHHKFRTPVLITVIVIASVINDYSLIVDQINHSSNMELRTSYGPYIYQRHLPGYSPLAKFKDERPKAFFGQRGLMDLKLSPIPDLLKDIFMLNHTRKKRPTFNLYNDASFARRHEIEQFLYGSSHARHHNSLLNTLLLEPHHPSERTGIVFNPASNHDLIPDPELANDSLKLLDYGESSLTIEIKKEKPGYLYWVENFHPDWRATIDGKPLPVYRANLSLMAFQVPAGEHTVEISFFPRAFSTLLATNYVFFGGICLVLTILYVRKRKDHAHFAT